MAADQRTAETQRTRIERSDLLALRVFWAIHYYNLIGSDDRDSAELVEPFFGISNDYANAYYVEHFDRSPWPFLRIGLPQGFAIEVEYALEPDSETRYIVARQDWEAPILLGYDSGHGAQPAFRWAEVVQVARCVSKVAKNPVHARAITPLLFPACYVTAGDSAAAIRGALDIVWRDLGVVISESIPDLVNDVVTNLSHSVNWWHDPQLGWINDGGYSLRNPATRMCKVDQRKFERITEFTNMLEAHS